MKKLTFLIVLSQFILTCTPTWIKKTSFEKERKVYFVGTASLKEESLEEAKNTALVSAYQNLLSQIYPTKVEISKEEEINQLGDKLFRELNLKNIISLPKGEVQAKIEDWAFHQKRVYVLISIPSSEIKRLKRLYKKYWQKIENDFLVLTQEVKESSPLVGLKKLHLLKEKLKEIKKERWEIYLNLKPTFMKVKEGFWQKINLAIIEKSLLRERLRQWKSNYHFSGKEKILMELSGELELSSEIYGLVFYRFSGSLTLKDQSGEELIIPIKVKAGGQDKTQAQKILKEKLFQKVKKELEKLFLIKEERK